jgi:AraC-like DNA-binding protein
MQTHFLKSLFHTPDELAQSAFIHVLRAGHLQAASDYTVERRFCVGHDLIYCVAGRGHVRIEGEEHTIQESQLLWIDGRLAHIHWADPDAPWEVLWVRADGAALTRSAEALNVKGKPVFSVEPSVAAAFHRVLDHIQRQPLALDALLHAETSAILSSLFMERHSLESRSANDRSVSPQLKQVIEKMAIYFHKHWTVAELAKMAGMTETNFYRCFHMATGSSPISWIRIQRVNNAKRRLVETPDSIKLISEQLGYGNPFYFSRDFKRACGVSPKLYRQLERHEVESAVSQVLDNRSSASSFSSNEACASVNRPSATDAHPLR